MVESVSSDAELQMVLDVNDPSVVSQGISMGMTQPIPYVLTTLGEKQYVSLHQLRDQAVAETIKNLQLRGDGKWKGQDDDLFAPHTALVSESLKHETPSLPIEAWNSQIRPELEACESKLMAQGGPTARLHKGAILHNVGLCHLMAGDLDSALQLYSAAGTEDELSGHGDWSGVVLGQHSLTTKLLINSLIETASNESDWAITYANVLNSPFNETELKSLLQWLAQKNQDAVQCLRSLHGFRMSMKNFPSNVQSHLQVRAIADLVLVVESSLRRWQQTGLGELFKRMRACFAAGSLALRAFDDAHDAYCKQFPGEKNPDKENEVGINWAINDCLTRYRSETSPARRAGIVGYLAVRLRNSLMHIILEGVTLYGSDKERLTVAGMMLAAIGISKYSEQRQLPTV